MILLTVSKFKRWTEDEIEQLKRMFPKSTIEEMVSNFNRSWEAIRSKAYNLGLRRDASIIYDNGFSSPLIEGKYSIFDLGFLIGIIEGEGCITIIRSRRHDRPNDRLIPVISIVNSDIDLLKKVHKIIGGVLVPHSYDWIERGEKRKFVVRIAYTLPVLKTLEKIQPYLITHKKKKTR